MPYFIYRVSPNRTLAYVSEFDGYRVARERIREMRAEQGDSEDTLRMVFASDVDEAETLLSMRRQPEFREDD